VLIDVANALTFETGRLTLTVCNTDSLGEQIQRAFPEARVVKTLNTMGNEVMIHPERVPGRHAVFVSGDDAEAKQHVAGMLESFGWSPESVVDLGGIETARGTEMYLVLWMEMMQARGERLFNISIAAPGG
jgi:predicted dinucleotide-binding enzyme